MIRTLTLACLFGLLVTASVQADVPLDKGLKYVDPVLAFEGVEKNPDYVFFIRFKTFTGGPARVKPTLKQVKDDKPFVMGAQRRLFELNVLAVPKKLYDEKNKADATNAWLTEKTEGVLAAPFDAPSTVGKEADKEVPVTHYNVTITDGKLVVKSVKKKADASLVPLWLVGLVSAFSLVWFGVWMTRRSKS